MKRYKSKIDLWISIPLFVALGGSLVFLVIDKEWITLLINLIISLFIYKLFSSTYYIIDANKLVIRSSFIINISINISEITQIKETRNPLSSPALSLDRIEIKYGAKSVMISPKEKNDFIEHLHKINPQIKMIYKTH